MEGLGEGDRQIMNPKASKAWTHQVTWCSRRIESTTAAVRRVPSA